MNPDSGGSSTMAFLQDMEEVTNKDGEDPDMVGSTTVMFPYVFPSELVWEEMESNDPLILLQQWIYSVTSVRMSNSFGCLVNE